MPAQGQVNVIASASVSRTPVADHAVTTDVYYERGLGRNWALVLAPSVSSQDNIFARNEVQISLRRSLWRSNGWAVSSQVGAFVWKEGPDAPTSTGVEVRAAVGRSFENGAWIDAEVGSRGCGGRNGLRWEGTLGTKLRRSDRALIKMFGDGEGCAADITRIQASYVYGVTDRLGIELGWRETLPNPGNWNERGAVLGLWVKF